MAPSITPLGDDKSAGEQGKDGRMARGCERVPNIATLDSFESRSSEMGARSLDVATIAPLANYDRSAFIAFTFQFEVNFYRFIDKCEPWAGVGNCACD